MALSGGLDTARFLGGWLLKSAAVLLAVATLNFFLLRLAPGDPAVVMAGEAGASDAQFLEQIRQDYGLDRPLPEQLWTYVANAARGNLGYSYRNRRPVADMILERLPATILLTGSAFVLALLLGTALGVLAPRAKGGGRMAPLPSSHSPSMRCRCSGSGC